MRKPIANYRENGNEKCARRMQGISAFCCGEILIGEERELNVAGLLGDAQKIGNDADQFAGRTALADECGGTGSG